MSISPALADKIKADASAAYEFDALKELRQMLNGGGIDAAWSVVMGVCAINNAVSQTKLFTLINPQPEDKEQIKTGMEPISCRELFAIEFGELLWNIDEILPAGTMLMFGKPKKGKSFLSMLLAISVSAKREVFGKQSSGRRCLYLGLEDSQRRLQRRVIGCANSLGIKPDDFQDNLHVTTTSKRIDSGLIGELEDWMTDYPDTGVIFVDMLKKVTGSNGARLKDLYAEQAVVGDALTRFCHRHPHLTVIVIHHSRKAESDDPFDLVSGTTGLSGSYDSLAAIVDAEEDRTLHITGRDVEGAEIPLLMNERGMYTLKMPTDDEIRTHGMSGIRRKVYDAVPSSQSYTRAEIIEGCDLDKPTVDQQLRILIRDKLITKEDRGKYVRSAKRFYDEPVKEF